MNKIDAKIVLWLGMFILGLNIGDVVTTIGTAVNAHTFNTGDAVEVLVFTALTAFWGAIMWEAWRAVRRCR